MGNEVNVFGRILIYLTISLAVLVLVAGVIYYVIYKLAGKVRKKRKFMSDNIAESRVNHFRRIQAPPTPERKTQVHPYIIMHVVGKVKRSASIN